MSSVVRDTKLEDEILSSLDSWNVIVLDEVDSTMNYARELLVHGYEVPTLILAKSQTAGRGRQGREWNSEYGGFYGTYIFSFHENVAALAGLSLAVGVSICNAFQSPKNTLALKWPNDILDQRSGGKVGGILIETKPHKSSLIVLIGIGLNINNTPHLAPSASTLSLALQKNLSLSSVASLISSQLWDDFELFTAEAFSYFRNQWLSYTIHHGRNVTIDTGTEEVSGSFLEVDRVGQLILNTPNGVRTIASGHMTKW